MEETLLRKRPFDELNIRVPMFVVDTGRDHIAPWRSVYKSRRYGCHLCADKRSHNAGIVSEPHYRGRRFRIASKRPGDPCVSADEWAAAVALKDGSWWVDWSEWLASHSAPDRVPPGHWRQGKGHPSTDHASGSYVLEW